MKELSKRQARKELFRSLDQNNFVGAAILGAAVISYVGSEKASKRAAQGAQDATSSQERMYWQTREDYAPWREAGAKALEGYMSALEDPSKYKKSPGYMFRLEEGLKAIGIPDGKTSNLSGPQLKAAVRYAEDYGTSDYDRYLQRYASAAGLGFGGTQGTATATQNFSTGIANTQQNAANARASGYVGGANAINQGAQNYMQYNMWQNNQQAQSYYGAGTSGVAGDAYAPAYGGGA